MQLILKIRRRRKIPYQVIAEAKGADLVGIKYEQLMPFAVSNPENVEYFGDFVTMKMEQNCTYIANFC
jgi:isoleucyl-tRNA synthetase